MSDKITPATDIQVETARSYLNTFRDTPSNQSYSDGEVARFIARIEQQQAEIATLRGENARLNKLLVQYRTGDGLDRASKGTGEIKDGANGKDK